MLINGKQIKSLTADKVITNTNRQFVSDAEKKLWNSKTSVNDLTVNSSNTWSSTKINSELSKKCDISPNYSLTYNSQEDALEIIFK